MWNPVPLPYKTDNVTITLPTKEEIRAFSNVMYERHVASVVAVKDQVVVKSGGSIKEWEGQALIYLEKYVPDVPAPRLYAMYYDSEQLFLVMQRMPGERLDRLWPSLTDGEKTTVSEQLRRVFDCLRQAECPEPKFFGGLDGGAVHHYLFYSQKGDQEFLGPFRDEAAFVKGLTDNFRVLRERNGHPLFKVQFYERHLGQVLRGHRPVLTHGNLSKRNIVVAEKRSHSLNEGERSFDVALVDWEMAGWLPDYWEYFCASLSFNYLGWEDDWCWRTGQYLDVWLAEAAVMRMFDKDMGP